jgi:hypothetical protein
LEGASPLLDTLLLCGGFVFGRAVAAQQLRQIL